MDAWLTFRPGLRVDVSALGLPVTQQGDRVRVSAPAWNEHQLVKFLTDRLRGQLTSLETVPSGAAMAGCKCLGRR